MKIKKIKKWMIDNDVTNKRIAEATGVSRALVSMTIKGDRHSKVVIDAFVSLGCPREYFEQER